MAQQESMNLVDFVKQFPNDDACRQYLFKMRWPEGFKCPVCGNGKYYLLAKYHLYQCTDCNHQVSVTAGTVMHKTVVSTAISEDNQATIPLFAKIKVSDKLSMKTVKDFVVGAIEPGSKITTDCFEIYNSLNDNGFEHDKYISGSPKCNQALDWAHTIISNAKIFILGTYHGLAQCHLQAYLDEFCYRLNRRRWVNQLFQGC
jgi:hypothetical protein